MPAAAPHTGEVWRIVAQPQSSLVFARDGSLIGEIGKEWRSNVPLRTLPPYVGQAFVAVEDQRFYKHDGVDLVGVAGALKDNLLGGSRGASTITQQLVGNMHPDIIDRTDKSLGRKLHEQQAAREMEKHYNKEQILEAYLNQILFGHGWYGIESAAQHYFGKGASKLTLAEAATLAALPKGPAIYDPIKYPDRARQRRDVVLTLMAEQKYITPEAAAAAKRETLRVAPNGGMSVRAPYFVDAVKTQLERAGVNVSEGGYRVYTTVDPVLQAAAQASLTAGVAAVEARPDYKHPTPARHAAGVTDFLEGAFIAMSPETGDVLAMVGGRDYVTAPYNRAVNGMRQPGSAFKPFVYATAILDSMPANSKVADTAITITYDRQTYQPRNADGEFLGELTMRNALARSRNPVAVQLWEKVGADAVINTARRVGLRSEIAPFPSSAIGASVVQPLNLVSAYTVFANLGSSVEPRLATKVESTDGRTVWSAGVVVRAGALDSNTAFIVRDMLRDVVERGTAASIRRYLPDIPVAGKTGTTDDVTDVWFVGLTPDIVAGVWLGFDRPKTIVAGAAGGTLAAPIFGEALAKWYRGRQPGQWTTPGGLVMAQLDRDSGNLADAATPADRRYSEYFLPGTEPAALRLDVRRLFTWGPIIF
ncbi:MAG TPA: PBP1A family penicillin-binding protein [Gemmatimonadaceae bacterium]|nr:PBP1A family penicillin-binding protein [Gemmatimonadaceae bacterium]